MKECLNTNYIQARNYEGVSIKFSLCLFTMASNLVFYGTDKLTVE